ncbi:MAG: hypothetical protein AAF517_27380, partial [Planctomycetota bacterium]
HPVLVRIAQTALRKETVDLRSLLRFSWGEFHEGETKVTHYALSWSIVYFLLAEVPPPGTTLTERIELLFQRSEDSIVALEGEWRAFLSDFSLTEYLVDLARSERPAERLQASWALRQMGSLYSLDDRRVIATLVDLLEHPDPARSQEAGRSFLSVLDRNPFLETVARRAVSQGIERLRRRLQDGAEQAQSSRVGLLSALKGSAPRQLLWVETLIPLLQDADESVRVAAASALTRLAAKPTIVSPEFWRAAPAVARDLEVEEWQSWLSDSQSFDLDDLSGITPFPDLEAPAPKP